MYLVSAISDGEFDIDRASGKVIVSSSFFFFFEYLLCGSTVAQRVKRQPAMRETPGSIPGLGRSPGEGNGNTLQYSRLEKSMEREAWWAAEEEFCLT